MNTKDWGPKMWYTLHTIAYNYPVEPTDENKTNYKNFYESLQVMLPCKYCRESWRVFLNELPIDRFLHSRSAMTFWIYLMHNKVNKKLRDQGNKIAPDPPYEEICKKYENIRADCSGPGLTCSKAPDKGILSKFDSLDTFDSTILPIILILVLSLFFI